MTFDNTQRTTQKPAEGNNHGHGKRYTHPAFGQIGAYRQQGGAEALYGSDFIHHSVVMIQIKRSSLGRDLSHDWHHGEDELIQIYLSESQWATFVSSMNMGDGVPCTLHRVGGEVMPGIELAQRTDQFKGEVEEHVIEAIREIDDVISKLPQKGEQAAKLRRARMQLQDNLPFIAKSFGQHMERTVEKAKTEIHGYMNATMQRLGLASAGTKPLELNAPNDDEVK